MTSDVQHGTPYRRIWFFGKRSALALLKSRFFHTVSHVRQPKPLLKTWASFLKYRGASQAPTCPVPTKKRLWTKGSVCRNQWMQPAQVALTERNGDHNPQSAQLSGLPHSRCSACPSGPCRTLRKFLYGWDASHRCAPQGFWKVSEK